jgi:hypothetical protein
MALSYKPQAEKGGSSFPSGRSSNLGILSDIFNQNVEGADFSKIKKLSY